MKIQKISNKVKLIAFHQALVPYPTVFFITVNLTYLPVKVWSEKIAFLKRFSNRRGHFFKQHFEATIKQKALEHLFLWLWLRSTYQVCRGCRTARYQLKLQKNRSFIKSNWSNGTFRVGSMDLQCSKNW